jgi:hypothetical protein
VGKAQTCKNNDHSQAWPSVAADENVCMGNPKTKKPRIVGSGAFCNEGGVFLETLRPAKRQTATLNQFQEFHLLKTNDGCQGVPKTLLQGQATLEQAKGVNR